VFPAFRSLPLPSNGALPWQGGVTGDSEATVIRDGAMTTLTANDQGSTIAGPVNEIRSGSFNPAAHAASSSAAVSAATEVEMNPMHEFSSSDLEFSFADTDADFFSDLFHDPFSLCDP